MNGKNLRFHPLVVDDIRQTYAWYEEQADRLGDRFCNDVDARFDDIVRQPEIYPHAFQGMEFRFAKLRKFPYLIIFRVSDSIIDILGVFHSASNPDKWRRR